MLLYTLSIVSCVLLRMYIIYFPQKKVHINTYNTVYILDFLLLVKAMNKGKIIYKKENKKFCLYFLVMFSCLKTFSSCLL